MKNTLSTNVKHQHEEEHQCEKHQEKDGTKKGKKCDKTKEKIVSSFNLSIQNWKLQTTNHNENLKLKS